MGVVSRRSVSSGCGCNEVYRFRHTTPLLSAGPPNRLGRSGHGPTQILAGSSG